MADNLLIVGGTGFIGRNLTIKAVEDGFNVTVLSVNVPSKENQIDSADYLQADITNILQLRDQLSTISIDYVVNLSGYIDHSQFLKGGRQVVKTHFWGVINLLQLLDWGELKRFVQIGSSDEYGNLPAPQNEEMHVSPISPYSLAKLASTQLLQMLYRTEGFPAVILRLFLAYGPGQDRKRFLPQIIQGCLLGNNFPTTAGEQLRDFCYVDDVTRGILLALKQDEANGEVINLASGKPVEILEVIKHVQKTVGQGSPEFGSIRYRSGENMELYGDILKAKRLLEWEPEVTLKEGIKRTVDDCRIRMRKWH